jgi:hypothetical protein
MPKGFFTQTLCVLTSRDVRLPEIAGVLKPWNVVGSTAANADWQLSAASLVVAYRPDVNGKITIDCVNHPWPDAMGDPKQDPTTFGAWSMGYFGPFTYPQGLARAGQHSWSWQPGRTIAAAHTGFIRIRSSYALGNNPNAPLLPKDYQPTPELDFLTKLALAILEVPGTLCYFNPGGEVLRDKAGLQELSDDYKQAKQPPLPVWCNVRFFALNKSWFLMDTVGNRQLDMPDLEVIFPIAEYGPERIDEYLRDVSAYLLDAGASVLRDGDKIDGPGESELSWEIMQLDDSAIDPPRPLFRLIPTKDKATIATITKRT